MPNETRTFDPDDDGPATGAQHLETNTRRPEKAEDRFQGPKTRAANRERAKGSPRFNPR